MHLPRPFPPALLLFALVGCALTSGCGRIEPIRTYTMPKRVEPVKRVVPEVDRMLAAYVVNGDKAWFFKVVGPKDAVGAVDAEFRGLVQSVRFSPAGEPQWKLPVDWVERPGNQVRYATLMVAGDVPLELTVVVLTYGHVAPQEFALNNLNRWREQLQLDPIDYDELNEQIEQFQVDGKPAVLSALLGELPDAGPPFAAMRGGAPPVDGHPPIGPAEPPTSAPPIGPVAPVGPVGPIRPAPPPVAGDDIAGDGIPGYELPEGWRSAPGDGVSRAAFAVVDVDRSVRITLSTVGGGLLANVDRWRGQIGLGAVSPDELANSVKSIELAGAPADYVILVGPENANPRESILAVVAQVGGVPWVVRLRGDAQLAERERGRFEAFVKSLRFN